MGVLAVLQYNFSLKFKMNLQQKAAHSQQL